MYTLDNITDELLEYQENADETLTEDQKEFYFFLHLEQQETM